MTSSLSQPYLPGGFLGPTFKADTKSAAIWTPSSMKTTLKSADEPSYYSSSSVQYANSGPPSSSSSTAYYLPPQSTLLDTATFQPVYFSPRVSSLSTAAAAAAPNSLPAISSSAPFVEPKISSSLEQSHLNLSSQKSPTAPIISAASTLGPPPAPPVYTPTQAGTAVKKKWDPINTKYSHLTPEEAAIAADPNRSIIEYPEKQTVAALRNKIETKLNGSKPVKGYSMMPHMEICAVKPQAQQQPKPPQQTSQSSEAINISQKTLTAPIAKIDEAETATNVVASRQQQPSVITDVKDKMDLVNLAVEDLKNAVYGAKSAAESTAALQSPPPIDDVATLNGGFTKDTEKDAELSSYMSRDKNIYSTSSIAPIISKERFAGPTWATTKNDVNDSSSTTTTKRQQALKSPTPPRVPPPPVQYTPLPLSIDTSETSTTAPVNDFARSSDFRHGPSYSDNQHVIRTTRSPPPSATLIDQKTTIDYDKGRIQTDKYYTLPYQETISSKRFISQQDSKRDEGIGPSEETEDKENQRHWYKNMYKKLHHLDRREDEAVLRYQMKDFLGEKYANESNVQRRRTDEENNPYVVTYKFADYLNEPDMDYERGYVPQPTYATTGTLSGRGTIKRTERETYSRTTRSKSASRFDSTTLMSPPVNTDVVRAGTPGERYKHQPKKIEDYVPGTSSVADYEHEKQRTVAASTRPQSSMAYASAGPTRLFGAGSAEQSPTVYRRRVVDATGPVSPVPRSEARQWYKHMQTGGDVPIGGLSQLAPERIGSPSSQIYADSQYSVKSVSKTTQQLPPPTNSSNFQNGGAASAVDKLPQEIEELGRLEKELVLEAERRKKFERELHDQRSRRHGYTPIQIKTPVITDSRFDKLMNTYANRPPPSAPSPTTSDFRGVARALYAFTAHTPRELTFFKGDLIKIRGIIDENWYEGELKGRVGILPSNYVELVAAAEGDERVVVTEVSKKREGQAQALYNFEGRRLNELPLAKGEIVLLTRKIDDHWYEGRNDMGRRGIFPSNYVKVFNEPSSQLKDFVSAFNASDDPSSIPDKCLLPGNEFRLQINGVQYIDHDHHSKNIDQHEHHEQQSSGVGGDGDPFAKKATHISTTTPSAFKSLDTAATKARSSSNNRDNNLSSSNYPKLSTDFNTRFNQQQISTNCDAYRTIFPYDPQNEDELALQDGDIVYVIEKCDDGWFIGTSLRTGKFGTFPGNYVKLM